MTSSYSVAHILALTFRRRFAGWPRRKAASASRRLNAPPVLESIGLIRLPAEPWATRSKPSQPFINSVGVRFGMDEPLPDLTEETFPQALRRRYAYLSSWLLRLNRQSEPSRLPEPTRSESEPRIAVPARQPYPPRPK